MAELTPEDLVDLDIPSELSLSPDGSQVVYKLQKASRKGEHDVSALWTADISEENSAHQLTSGQFNDRRPKWSPDGKSIAFLSDRAKAGKSCAIYVLNMTGGEPYSITDTSCERPIAAFEWSPCGKFIAFVSADEKSKEKKAKEEEKDDARVYGEEWAYRRLRLLHVATREVTVLYSEEAHVAEFSWHLKHHSLEIAYTLEKTPDINAGFMYGTTVQTIDVRSKSTKVIIRDTPGKLSKIIWASDRIFFIRSVRPHVSQSSRAVHSLTLDNAQIALIKIEDGKNDVQDIVPHPNGGVLVHLQKGVGDELWQLQTQEQGVGSSKLDIIAKSFSSLVVNSQSDSAGTEHRLTACWIASNPGVGKGGMSLMYEHSADRQGFKADCILTSHNASLRKPVPGSHGYVESSGFKVSYVYMTPNGPSDDEKGWPAVMLVHGGPYYRSTVSFEPDSFHWAAYLVSAGYAIICPNYSGSSGLGDDFTKASQGGMGTNEFDDIIAVVKHVTTEGLPDPSTNGKIDPDRVVIGGWSQGGFLSYLATTRRDFTFKGAICGAGVTDWDMMCMTSDAYYFESEMTGKAPWVLNDRDAEYTKGRHGSAIWHMKTLAEKKTPVLILHGEADVRVPLTQAHAFRRGCEHWGIPYQMVVYPREPHAIAERAHRLDMLKRVRAFVDLHIGR